MHIILTFLFLRQKLFLKLNAQVALATSGALPDSVNQVIKRGIVWNSITWGHDVPGLSQKQSVSA
jgi:hypothetical protein